MNILFILTNYPGFGGIEKVTSYIISFLINNGYHIHAIAYGSNAPQLINSHPKGMHIHYVPEPNKYGSKVNTNFIRDYLFSHEFNFIVWQDSYAPIEHLINDISYPWKEKLIVVEHNSPSFAIKTVNSYFYYKNGMKYFIERCIKYPLSAWKAYSSSKKRHSYIFNNCRKYVLLSEAYRNELKLYVDNWNNKKVSIIANPLTIEKPEKDFLIKKKQVLFVGRLTNQKGVNLLLSIWKEFSKHNDNKWKLVILGEGPKRNEIERIIQEENLSSVCIDSPTSEIARYYEESAILAMTSIFEGFPLVIAEAMSRGCIPFAFESFKSVYDIIDNGKNGMLFKPFNEIKYVKSLIKITNNENQLRSMSLAAKETVKRFDIASIGNKWINLFEELS